MNKCFLGAVFFLWVAWCGEIKNIQKTFHSGEMELAHHALMVHFKEKRPQVMSPQECRLKFELEMGLCTKGYKERSERHLQRWCAPLLSERPKCHSKSQHQKTKAKIKRWIKNLKLEAYIMEPHQPNQAAWRRRVYGKLYARLK